MCPDVHSNLTKALALSPSPSTEAAMRSVVRGPADPNGDALMEVIMHSPILTNQGRLHFQRSTVSSLICFGAVLLLAAGCGGGGGGGESAPPDRLTTLDIAMAQMQSDYSASELTPSNNIPSDGGSSTYEGYVAITLQNTTDDVTDRLVGEMTLDVAFNASVGIGGGAHGFVDQDSVTLSGTLNFSNGSFDRGADPNSDALLTFAVKGDLSYDNGGTIAVEGGFFGDFLGPNANAVAGGINGTADIGENSPKIAGSFIAERIDP